MGQFRRPARRDVWLSLFCPACGGGFDRHQAGLNDAREGRPAYFWAAFADHAYRTEFRRGGWKDIRTPFFVSAALDAIYQVFEHQGIYFLEMVFTAIVLAVAPYVLIRASASRVTQVFHGRRPKDKGK